jgi:hypothetical protein
VFFNFSLRYCDNMALLQPHLLLILLLVSALLPSGLEETLSDSECSLNPHQGFGTDNVFTVTHCRPKECDAKVYQTWPCLLSHHIPSSSECNLNPLCQNAESSGLQKKCQVSNVCKNNWRGTQTFGHVKQSDKQNWRPFFKSLKLLGKQIFWAFGCLH